MRTKIELQPRQEQHLARWEELGADPKLAKLPYKIETDRLGRILMSPPPFFDHTRHVARIINCQPTTGHCPLATEYCPLSPAFLSQRSRQALAR